MIGFQLVNLVIPGAPISVRIATRNGEWLLEREEEYEKIAAKLLDRVSCAETYVATHGGKTDEVFDELLYISLASSFLTGSAVTTRRSLPYSEIMIIEAGPRFPRERGLSNIPPAINSGEEFAKAISVMVETFPTIIRSHNIEVIIHHWLDSLASWSIEDLYLSACTILEIIKQNERRRTGDHKLHFYDAITSAPHHYKITCLSRDWISMRNDLIHEGKLSGTRSSNKGKAECNAICTGMLDWIDEYVHAVFGIPQVKTKRFSSAVLSLNSYTIY